MAHILIAEDDRSMCGFLQMALEKAGHSVETAHNGIAALKAIENARPPFDLLLSDIVMPGMDGIELSKKAAQLCPDLKIMFITGFAAVAMDRPDLPQDTGAKILSKPFHLNDLVKQVESLLAG